MPIETFELVSLLGVTGLLVKNDRPRDLCSVLPLHETYSVSTGLYFESIQTVMVSYTNSRNGHANWVYTLSVLYASDPL